MIIRKAEFDEYPAILEFYYSISESMADSPYRPVWRRDGYPNMEDLVGNLFIADLENEGVIGAILINNRPDNGMDKGAWTLSTDQVAYSHLPAVSPGHQGEGVARKLLTHAIDSVRSWAETVRLVTLANSTPAKRLYEEYGFHSVGDVDVEYAGVGMKTLTLYEYII